MSRSSSPVGMAGSQTVKKPQSAESGSIQPLQVIGERLNDSGYSSSTSTPRKVIEQNHLFASTNSNQPPLSARLSALAKSATRKIENNKTIFPRLEVDDGCREAYARIQPHFERQLREYILAHPKHGETCYPLWIRLLMVGTSETDSDVHIVVFCKPKYKDVVQRFSREDHVTELCRASGVGSRPFELHVEGIAPRLRHAIVQVIVDSPSQFQETLCGTPISLHHPSGRKRNATLGGVVKVVVDTRGEFRLYGISAGHVLEEVEAEANENAEQIFDVGDHEFDSIFEDSPGTLTEDGATLSDSWVPAEGECVGVSTQMPSVDSGAAAKRHDWALFDMTTYLPNRVKESRGRNIHTSTKAPGQTGAREAYFLSGSGPHGTDGACKKGLLSPAPGRIALGPTLELFDAYILTVADESRIHDGDSGSWIIDCHTLELYGHLVATDFLDEGIIVPMKDIFEDIKEKFHAVHVGLPSDVDLFATLPITKLPHNKLDQAQNTVLPDSGYGSAMSTPSRRLWPRDV